MFPAPVVFEARAPAPLAVLLMPVLFWRSASAPLAVFPRPVVLLARALCPLAVLFPPAIVKLPALLPRKTLLSPKSCRNGTPAFREIASCGSRVVEVEVAGADRLRPGERVRRQLGDAGQRRAAARKRRGGLRPAERVRAQRRGTGGKRQAGQARSAPDKRRCGLGAAERVGACRRDTGGLSSARTRTAGRRCGPSWCWESCRQARRDSWCPLCRRSAPIEPLISTSTSRFDEPV